MWDSYTYKQVSAVINLAQQKFDRHLIGGSV